MSAHPALTDTTIVVLDTNVVLDWLLFNDPVCRALTLQIRARRLIWHTTLAMRDELLSVLPRTGFHAWNPNCERILSDFDQWSSVSPGADAEPESPAPRCRDPDDQKFIDLACARSARWLFSRDNALLALAKPAHARGVEILTPASWLRRYPSSLPGDIT